MGFKENLRRLREVAGLTQTQAAERAGVPFRSYQNWEAGTRGPRVEAISALAAAFGVTVDALLAATPAKSRRGRGKGAK